MGRAGSPRNFGRTAAGPFAAALGILQPGIDPVFLTLLSQASRVPLTAHGMVVGGTQAGAALGSLAVWRLGALLPHGAVVGAATLAFACSLATALTDALLVMLALRCLYGVGMGVVYAYSMSAYAAHRPNKAYGAVFLIQLILSTLVSVLLPELELAIGAEGALAAMALAPASALAMLLLMARQAPAAGIVPTTEAERAFVPMVGWALAAATFWFICSTMLVWSSAAMLATQAGIEDRTIGHAVAIGSIVGAVTAALVMRERLLIPLPVTALLSGAGLASPLLLTAPGQDMAFIVSIILLNIGSTAIIIRTSGLATATSSDRRFRTLVVCAHSFGLIAGPLLGSAFVTAFGSDGLYGAILVALPAGIGATIIAAVAERMAAPNAAPAKHAAPQQMALD